MSKLQAALGAAAFGTTVARESAFEILDTFASLGGRAIDTANNYAYWVPGSIGGDSETVLGDWLEQRERSAFTVITQVGSLPADTASDVRVPEGLAPDVVHRSAAACRARLKCDGARFVSGRWAPGSGASVCNLRSRSSMEILAFSYSRRRHSAFHLRKGGRGI